MPFELNRSYSLLISKTGAFACAPVLLSYVTLLISFRFPLGHAAAFSINDKVV